MGRQLRRQFAGAIYHLTARGNNRGVLFANDADRFDFLGCLDRARKRSGLVCLSFCLMGNHLHLVIETPDANIAEGMHLLGSSYARRFNSRHRRSGHVFEARYHDVVLHDDRQFAAAMAYVGLNPVRAGLCDRPGDWRWSAHSALAGQATPPPFLAVDRALELLGGGHATYGHLFV